MHVEQADLVVLGGGPGGSTLSTLVAMQGHRVILLERERFPRHQLGESLLPATIHGICPLLGVKDEIDAAGFQRKLGGTFLWGTNPKPWTFAFARTPNAPMGYAYQVERARFDHILLNNARRKGVIVREEHRVQDCIVEGDRVVGVRYQDPGGETHEIRARFVADAEGHKGGLYKLAGDRVFSNFFQNVALYGYFENGKRLPPPNSGNILSAAFSDGWFWYIPLTDTLTSVGVVVAKERALELLREGEDTAFRALVRRCPIVDEYLRDASRVTSGMYGVYRVRKDYSYCNTRFWSPGLVLVGDAACFIDPVFSSGVHLSTYSALLAARSINTLLGPGGVDEGTAFSEFERRYRREFGNFYQFLTAFYDLHRDESSYFWQARKVLASEEEDAASAFVRLVAGLSERDEPIFDGRLFHETVKGLGGFFESLGEKPSGAAPKPAGAGFDPDVFMAGFTKEITQLQLQARLGAKRPEEAALFEGGLVPTRDGLHWCKP